MYPEDLKYTETHEWARVEGTEVTVGISSYAANELGDIVFVDMPEVGAAVAVGESMGSIEYVKAVEELRAPVTGTVSAINEGLADTPEVVNSDPYGEGWMVKVTLSDAGELAKLLDAAAYKATIESGS